MNQHLKTILDFFQQNENLTADEKDMFSKAIKEVDKELVITTFKLDRTEKVKRTTAILLEETIDELEKKRVDVEQANLALKKSLEELKAAQAQLIQSEKMASLGELTAGIAHEIQNPLNFVNNYSEVNKELLEELIAEAGKEDGEKDERLMSELMRDVAENEIKILHHGKRADAIVRSMLQHSRSSSNTREPTNLNALADEFLQLAYHSLRAKDSSFQADFRTDFDENLPLVEVVPQDLGRVLLNIINNAFQACAERSRSTAQPLSTGGNGEYTPLVIVSTKQFDGSVEIRITDNGNGIPEEVKDKIFQPFFTTKPTGQGTGLGLSLAYDIVKAHGGTIEVETEVGEGTTLGITIPHQS